MSVGKKVPEERIAYLTGEYPKVSHTFIQREIAALRALGLKILPCTIRRAPPETVSSDQQEEAHETFCVLDAAKSPGHLVMAHVRTLRNNPWAWFEALRIAWKTRPPGAKAGLWQLFYFLEAGVLSEHLRKISARHLHNHFASSSCTVAMLAAKMSGVSFSFTLHGPTELFAPEYWRLDEKIAQAAFSVYISHFARSQGMLFSDPAHWHRMRIVHCGITPDFYAGRPTTNDQGGRLVFVGRLSGVKGASLVLDALAKLAVRYPSAQLTMVGDGPERAALEHRAKVLGIADRVTFTGYLDQVQVASTLAASDILVLPSFAEGVPIVLMEAMATGLPVITTHIAGIPELVEHGVSGFVLPPGDTAALVDALDALMANPARCAEMGRAGRAKVTAEYNLMQEAAWLAELFTNSLAGKLPETLRPAPPARRSVICKQANYMFTPVSDGSATQSEKVHPDLCT
ncbi:glycosyltransferase family 4 protein [Paracoccus sp. WLY502]|uniref:glycosyltransferase family 4 protein n=1 Tax=Paracoccus yibinensis TaxID=3068891 RepID=UPI002796854B|nr:glycosyltransferase family 4 protein [Paracoccus sp. WLY502]MDQ1902705.1 glycosyltransferase family 4 protein [Paracoccus sp. WLY502]